MTYTSGLYPMPVLAKSWAIGEDGKESVFKLQENVKCHEGHPMTADDIVFSITGFHREPAPRARIIFQNIDTCTAIDLHAVRIVLKNPFQPFSAGVRRDGLLHRAGGAAAGRHKAVQVHLMAARQFRPARPLRRLAEAGPRLGSTMLFITDDLRAAAQICGRVAVMQSGAMVEQGPTAEVFAAPAHAYTRQLLDSIPGRGWSPPVA